MDKENDLKPDALLTERMLSRRFDEALARMPCQGETRGLLTTPTPEDSAFRMTMVDLFVTPFRSVPRDEGPLSLLLKTRLWVPDIKPTHEGVHRRALGAYMLSQSMNFNETGKLAIDPSQVRHALASDDGFKSLFEARMKVNAIKAQTLMASPKQ